MAEFCKDCAKNILKISEKDLAYAIFSDDLDICEGCGRMKPVLITTHPTLGARLYNIGCKMIRKINK